MKKVLLTAAVLTGFGSAAFAGGIEPVTIVQPDETIVVGTQSSVDPLYIVGGAVVLGLILATHSSSSDGTN